MQTRQATTWIVVPCAAEKATAPAKARDLYTSPNFRLTLAAAIAEAGDDYTVLILSAKHGLVHLDTVLAPYDTKMGDADAITPMAIAETAADLGMEYGDEVFGMLPKAYREALAEALAYDDINVQDVYEAAPGIGYQRGVAATVARAAEVLAA